MTVSKWIEFIGPTYHPGRKTPTWSVLTKDGGAWLGEVAWYSPWRKYSFFPNDRTLYEPTCLRDIAQFIDDRMQERKSK